VVEPQVTIIIPAYARPRLLGETLASVLAQTLPDFECIVVDDASPIPLVVPDDPRIRVVRRETNGGQTVAWNTGLDHARGRYVTFLDDDDLFTPERLRLGLDGLARAPLSICWAQWTNRSGRTSWSRTLGGDIRDSILGDVIPHVGQMIMRRDLAPRFDERFTLKADVDWWIRVAQEVRVTTVPRIGYVWRAHAGPRLSSRVLELTKGHLLLLQVHADFFATRPGLAAQRWSRVGAGAYRLREYHLARMAYGHALRLRPDFRTASMFARSLRPSMTTGALEDLEAMTGSALDGTATVFAEGSGGR
jgi:glycosyltransferase involved in cell wall biosynthesis